MATDTGTNNVEAAVHTPQPPVQLSQEQLAEIQKHVARYPEGKQKSALIPVLHLAQQWAGGWLPVAMMDAVAGALGITPIEVYEVATFYTMFNLKPVGKYVLEVCHTGPCMTRGSDQIIEHIKTRLDIGPGQTTPDGLFTLKPAECLGACGYAPMMQLGKFYKEHLTIERVDRLIDELSGVTQN